MPTPNFDRQLLDVCIIGAGVYGICAANTYLSIHPDASLKVLEGDEDVGGVWATSRLYPHFWSQTGARLSGYPDIPFKVPEDYETYHDLFEAKHLSKYLEDYVSQHDYNGQTLRERFTFNCSVTKVTREVDGGAWRVEAKLKDEKLVYHAKKLIIATGLSSLPYLPELPGQDRFRGVILHQKDFGRSRVLTPDEDDIEKHTHVTVVGGSKSAADIAYAAAVDPYHTRKVSWIIRASGSGPLSFTKPDGFWKYRGLPEAGSTRALGSLSSANPFLPEGGWWQWFVHKTRLGDWLLEKMWRRTEVQNEIAANFDGREGALEGFDGMRSQTNVRWREGHLGILHRPDFWDVIARNVRIHRADVKELTDKAVVLDDGTEIETDMLLCGTGWIQAYPFFETHEAAKLGLPIDLNETQLVRDERYHWSDLEQTSDRAVLQRWPQLSHVPNIKKSPQRTTSYKLYNFCIPIEPPTPEPPTIVFLGLPLVPNSYHTSFIQSLYAVGTLDGNVQLPSKAEMEADVAFMNAWCHRRYPAHGHMGNVVEAEMVGYTDRLLSELGLESHRNKESWWKDLTDPCLASDYAGLMDEYKRKFSVRTG